MPGLPAVSPCSHLLGAVTPGAHTRAPCAQPGGLHGLHPPHHHTPTPTHPSIWRGALGAAQGAGVVCVPPPANTPASGAWPAPMLHPPCTLHPAPLHPAFTMQPTPTLHQSLQPLCTHRATPPRYAQTPNALSEHAAHPLQPAPVPAPPPAPSAPSAAAELPAQCPAAPPPRLLPQCRGARCRSGGVTRSIVGEPPATGHCQRRSSSRREGRCSHCWWPGWGRGARTLGCCMPTGAPREPQAGRGQLPALPSPVTAAALSEEAALLFHPALVKNTTPDFNTAAASAILGREQEAKPRVGPGPARPPHLRATPRGEPGARAAAPARCPEVLGAVGAI